MGITPFFINNKPDSIPQSFDKNDINRLDRSLMFSYKEYLDIISDTSPYLLAALPVISLIPNIKDRDTVLTYAVMYSEALLLTYGTAFSVKRAVNRYRPYLYTDDKPNWKKNDSYNSFPSGSTSFMFVSSAFLSFTFCAEFPQSKWKLPVVLGSSSLAAGIGAMRIVSGSHFLTDVLAGAAIGSVYGVLIPLLHLNLNTSKVSLVPAVNGINFLLSY